MRRTIAPFFCSTKAWSFLCQRTAAGEHDPGIPAVIAHRLVHENAVVVRVETEQFERQPPANLAQHLPEQGLFAVQKRCALGPSCGDVGDSKRLHEAPVRHRAAMRDEVGLDEPRRRVVPVRERAHRNAAANRRWRRRPTAPPAASLFPDRAKRPVDRRRAHGEYRGADLRTESQMAVPFHRLDQRRYQRLQAFATDSVRCLPQNDYCLTDRLVVDPPTGLPLRAACGGVAPQQPHRVLSVKAGDRNEFVENACLLGAPGNCVPSCQSVNQFVPCRHAYLPHSNAPRAIVLGSISHEATPSAKGAFQVRQCDRPVDRRRGAATTSCP